MYFGVLAMDFSLKNDVLLEQIRPLFYKVGNYYRNTSTEKITSKYFLHRWYFDLYETMYANGIIIGSNYFLSIFLQYVKNENTFLYKELQKISKHEYVESMNCFINTQVSVRYLDYLLDHNFNRSAIRDEIDGLKHDMDSNNKFSIPFEKEERTIHLETIKLLESFLDDDDRDKKLYLPMNMYINALDLQEVKEHIQLLILDDEQKALCSGETDIKRAKEKIIENINCFNDAFQIEQSQKNSSILMSKENTFTSELFLDAIKKGFTVEFFFTCFANESSRSKLKTRAFSDKPKYAKIKEFARAYYELTKGKKSSLSYIPLMIFGLETGLNSNSIYKLTNQFYSFDSKSELNRNEFNKNLQLFSKETSKRKQLDACIDTLGKKSFEENEYVFTSYDESDLNSIISMEFYFFIDFYIASNDIEGYNTFFDNNEKLYKVHDIVITEEVKNKIEKLCFQQ